MGTNHPHHRHLDSALRRVGKQPQTLAEKLAQPRRHNDEAAIRARRADQEEQERAQERTRRRLEGLRRARLYSFGLAGGRRTYPEER